jgi:hypothetical protein
VQGQYGANTSDQSRRHVALPGRSLEFGRRFFRSFEHLRRVRLPSSALLRNTGDACRSREEPEAHKLRACEGASIAAGDC